MRTLIAPGALIPWTHHHRSFHGRHEPDPSTFAVFTPGALTRRGGGRAPHHHGHSLGLAHSAHVKIHHPASHSHGHSGGHGGHPHGSGSHAHSAHHPAGHIGHGHARAHQGTHPRLPHRPPGLHRVHIRVPQKQTPAPVFVNDREAARYYAQLWFERHYRSHVKGVDTGRQTFQRRDHLGPRSHGHTAANTTQKAPKGPKTPRHATHGTKPGRSTTGTHKSHAPATQKPPKPHQPAPVKAAHIHGLRALLRADRAAVSALVQAHPNHAVISYTHAHREHGPTPVSHIPVYHEKP